MPVLAYADDLMDRSKISAAFPDAGFSRSVGAAEADIVIVDLARYGDRIVEIRTAHPNARIIAFGSHVDRETAQTARDAGIDIVVARSEFFRDPRALA
jgi:voltage-gated potassium channel Kch